MPIGSFLWLDNTRSNFVTSRAAVCAASHSSDAVPPEFPFPFAGSFVVQLGRERHLAASMREMTPAAAAFAPSISHHVLSQGAPWRYTAACRTVSNAAASIHRQGGHIPSGQRGKRGKRLRLRSSRGRIRT